MEQYLRLIFAAGTAASVLGLVSCGSDDGGSSNNTTAGSPSTAGNGPGPKPDPNCKASDTTEAQCIDGKDDDCDGFVDCLDTDCDGQSCGDGLSCLAGACLGPGTLPELPRIENLVPIVRGDTAIISFEAVEGALDYRIYPLPADEDVLVGAEGEVVIRDAIYRCSGARPRVDRRQGELKSFFDVSIEGDVKGYKRTEAESVLGHVFTTPGPDRLPIYRVGNPNSISGYTWEYQAPPGREYNGAAYVDTTEERDALLAMGWRDDGIAFYAPAEGTATIYRNSPEEKGVTFFTDGPEADKRGSDGTTEAFKALAEPTDGSVPLYRVHYAYNHGHDNLAAGAANRDRFLYQGQAPVTSSTWSGLTESTTLVIEALDAGCPFPNGYVAAMSAPADEVGGIPSQPSITIDEARSPDTGEAFINGQFEPTNRPKPIARGYVTVEPKAHPVMDWYQSFDSPDDVASLEQVVDDPGTGIKVFRNEAMSLEFEATTPNMTYGQMLGQLAVGSSATYAVAAVGANATLSADSYLHATLSTDFSSTNRRYPQIFITDTPLGDPASDSPQTVPFTKRFGPLHLDGTMEVGEYRTIVTQTFGSSPELQVEFCDLRGWGVSAQCPKANVYGYLSGSNDDDGKWLPIPSVADYIGMDRPMKFDVYASTERVYLFVEDQPAGCAVLPAGRMPAGPVNVIFGIAAYHIEIDEFAASGGDAAPQQYLRRYSLAHTDRKLDDLGVSSGVQLPYWDERMICGERYNTGFLGTD